MLSNNVVFQNAWVVDDFQTAMDHWTKLLGVGPFFVMNFEGGAELAYRGQPGALKMRVALAQAGDIQIELIEPISDAPNVYRDLVKKGETRFHHICLWSDNLEADVASMENAGYPCAMYSGAAASRFAYFDTSVANGHMVEILERKTTIASVFDRVKAIGSTWDGTRPIREFSELLG